MDKKKILVIDYEPDLINVVKTRLEASGYEVISASNGLEGLKRADQKNPDLILLDIKMAQMDGYTTLRKLKHKKKTESIPVIILTGYEKMKDMFDLEGATDYIVKPFDSQDLLLRISRALKKEN